MLDYFARLFDSTGFPPRWRCGSWSPEHGWLHILSDLGVWAAYMAIPLVLASFVARRKDLPFRRLFVMFTLFILACGSTHLMEAAIFWWPAYRLAGLLKLVTAVVSWLTVLALIRAVPRMLTVRTSEELEREVAARRAAEAGLVRANAELEERVRERTDELTRANAALFAERERFRTTLESIGDAVIATDTLGRVTFLNPVAEAHTGWTAGSAIGRDLPEVFPIVNETTRAAVENPVTRALRDGVVVGLANHTILISRDGRETPIDDSAAPIRDRDGGVGGAVLVFRDIAERRAAETRLRESESRYRQLFESNPHPMWVYDRETLAFLAVNDAAVAKYGYAREEFAAKTILEIRPAEEVPALLANIEAGVEGLEESGAWRHCLRDGRVIRVRIASHKLTFDGRSAKLVLAEDVTERLAAEEALRASEERFRAFMDNSPAAAWVTDADGRISYLSASYYRTFRLPPGDAVGRRVAELYPPDIAGVYLRNTRAVADSGEVLTATEPGVRADGTTGEFLVYKFPLPDTDGGVRVGGVAVDVTDLRAAETALRASEERLVLALSAGGMGTFDWDLATDGLVWSKSHYELFGYDGEAFPVRLGHFLDRIHPEDRAGMDRRIREAMESGSPYAHEYRVRTGGDAGEGGERWLAGTGRFQYDDAGRPLRMLGVVQDVTSRRAAEAAVRASERLLRQVIDTDPNFVAVKDEGGRFTLANRAMADAYGTTTEAIVGRTDADFHPVPSEFAAYRQAELAVLETGAEFHAPEEPFTTSRGERRWLRTTKRPLLGEAGRPTAVLAIAVDITAQKEAADRLEAANRLYRLLADHGRDVVMLVSAEGEGLYVSPSCERATGYPADEVLRGGVWWLVHPDDLAAAREGMAAAVAGRPGTVEWRCRHREGRTLWMETSLTPVFGEDGSVSRVVASSRDVTGRQAAEERLRQARKLEAIGQLAGGVAHDFNNLLTVVNGCGELLLADLTPAAPTRPLVEDIVRAGERGAALTRQLLAFSRQQMLRVEVFDLNRVLPETARLLSRLLGEDIALRVALDPSAGRVRADVGQIEQVVINLAVNGRDAMPQGGPLSIETAAADVSDSDPALSPDAAPGRYVRLTVTDGGVGMTPEVQARLFEPFFTTKPAGRGTGLGLATVYGIVRQSGGFLSVRSEPGRGTSIAAYLPRFEEPEESKADRRPTTGHTGSETLLVVEDDQAVRSLAARILRLKGYRVEAAESGAAALQLCERLPAPPDLVMTDVVMPGMSGRELAEKLVTRYPRLKVVFLSGYTADAVLRHGIEEERVSFLQKPYTPDTLARFVREVLDQPPPG